MPTHRPRPPQRAPPPALRPVHEICNQYDIIAGYLQRPRMNEQFAHEAEEYNEAKLPAEIMEVNSGYVPGWVSTLLVGGYMAFMAPSVRASRDDTSYVLPRFLSPSVAPSVALELSDHKTS